MRILNDILDLSKLEAGELVIIEEPFSLDDCLRHIINQFSGLSKNKNLEIINNCNSISDLNIISDELRIKQVLSNLISNAIKFSNDKDIEVGVKILNKLEQNIKLEIYVKDQGIGISREALTKILDPFSQADATTTRLYGGTGLGLTISKKIVEILGGTLKIESELGKGSCFSIIFDFSIPMQSNYDSQLINIDHDLEEYEHHSINILLVEDNIVNQKVMGKYFKKLNYDIKIVNNGIEAVDICSKEKFDLIFMDMQMPQMGGVEATRLIRKNSLNESTFIVALTANVLKVHKEECLAVGMNQFITKPVKINQIKKSIVDSINFNSLKLKK
jgi:CheY-like chemotaxis protein/anti-sigma regulatory factor (Ser/Thr protein kinase)